MPFDNPADVEAHPIDDGAFVMHTHNPNSDFTEYTLDNGATWLTPNHAQTYVDEHPVVYYRLGETSGTVAHDSSGNNRHGTYSGAYSLGQPSALSSSLPDPDKSFYTPNLGGVTLPSAQFPKLTSSQLTVSAWIYPVSITGTRHIASVMNAQMTANATNWSWGFRTNASKLELVVRGSGTQTSTSTNNYVVMNTWQHVAVVYNGANIYFYYNGILVDTKSGSQTISTSSTADFKVGLNSQSTSNFMGGLDEVAVFDYAMSAQKMRKVYLAGISRFGNSTVIRGLTNGTTYNVGVRLSKGAEKSYSIAYREVTPTAEAPLLVLDRFNRENSPNHPGHPDYGPSSYNNLSASNTVGVNNNQLYCRASYTSGAGVVNLLSVNERDVDLRYTLAALPTGANERVGFYVRYLSDTDHLFIGHEYSPSSNQMYLTYRTPNHNLFATSTQNAVNDRIRLVTTKEKLFIYKNDQLISYSEDPMYLESPTMHSKPETFFPKTYTIGPRFYGGSATRFDNFVVYKAKNKAELEWISDKPAFLYKGRATKKLDRPKYQP